MSVLYLLISTRDSVDMPPTFKMHTKIRVAHADVQFRMAFTQTLEFWREQFDTETSETEHVAKNTFGMRRILVEGTCKSKVKLPFGGLVLINGDLASTIHVGVYAEIVIAGDILPTGAIKSSGFCNVFVGGKCDGNIQNSKDAKIWIESSFAGMIKTGLPSSEIHIGKHCYGQIRPLKSAGILWLVVEEFMPQTAVNQIVDHRYIQFNAAIGKSNSDAGIYPVNRPSDALMDRWCVGEMCLPPSGN